MATVLVVAAPPLAIAGQSTLRPGDAVEAQGRCTLGWVLEGAGATYFSTAAHCVELGDRPTTGDGTVIGRVAYDDDVVDVALIEVAPGVEPTVDPSVRGHPEVPTGVAETEAIGGDDTLRVSGQGIGVPLSFAREQRAGVLIDEAGGGYCADLPAVFGDSGGPVLHEASGTAVGIVNRIGGACPTSGVTVSGILARTRQDGFDLALATP